MTKHTPQQFEHDGFNSPREVEVAQARAAKHTPGKRTWNDDKRCDECCNGDRCDDPTHYSREHCPHCKGTGWALWTDAGREDYARYLQGWCRMSEADARAAIARATGAHP